MRGNAEMLKAEMLKTEVRRRAWVLLGALRAAKFARGGVLRGRDRSRHSSGIKTRQAGFAQGLQWVRENGLDSVLAGNGVFGNSLRVEPLEGAVARMGAKVAVGTKFSSAEMEAVPLALRERAFWSARLQSAHLAQGLLDMARAGAGLKRVGVDRGDKRVDLTMSRSLFVREGRKLLDAAGYVPGDPSKEGTLLDHRSKQRLDLIYETNMRQAAEYARWQAGQDEGALAAYPAQELIREEQREVPRDWIERWRAAGGKFYGGGRMVALKSDPIWMEISRFGTPFPPFDFNSGMGVEDVSREDAEAWGLIKPGEVPKRSDVAFNDKLSASVQGLDAEVVESLNESFDAAGGLVELKDGLLQWIGGRHSVAIAMDVPESLPHAEMIKEAVADVARVHDYTDTAAGVGIPVTPVGSLAEDATEYAVYFPDHKGKGPAIHVNPAKWDALSVVHEMGHEVDHRLFGRGNMLGTQMENPELGGLMKAIGDSPEIKAIEAMKFPGQSKAAKESRKYKRYLLNPEEQFARAYSQWIGERSGRTKYGTAIAKWRSSGWESQWSAETFAPIAGEFEKLFKKKGWLR